MKWQHSDQYLKIITTLSKKCIGENCGRCKQACEIIKKTPAEQLEEVKHQQKVDFDIPFSCTQCGLCESICPANIQISLIYLEQRRDIMRCKKTSGTIHGIRSIKMNQMLSFSKIMKAASPTGTERNSVFMPGCSLSAYSPQLVSNVFEYLKNKLPGTGILLSCCGAPTHLIGDEPRHERYYNSFVKDWKALGSPEIITACPSCYKIIAEKSPDIKLKSIWELLDEIGLPKHCGSKPINDNLILHDPCPTRNYGAIHKSVRNLLDSANISVLEFAKSKENTLCCGLGGMVGATNPDIANKNICRRVAQASSSAIVTYCASCVDAFRSVGKESYYLLELIFSENRSLLHSDATASHSTVSKWKNRYKLRAHIIKQNRQGGKNV